MWKKKTLLIGIACMAIGLAIVMLIRARGSDPSRILARADDYFAQEQYDSARLEYSNLIRKEPGNARAYQQIGYGYLEQGLTYQGIQYLLKSLELEPDSSAARGQLASALMSFGDVAGARAQALEVLDRVPTDEQAILILARTSFEDKLVAETQQRLAGFDPEKQAAPHLAEAILAGFTEPGASDAAKASLERALALEPESVEVHLTRASFFQASGDEAGQRSSLAKASELSPIRSAARIRYAGFLASKEETDKAVALLTEQVSKVPDYVPARIALAEIEALRGRHDEAIAELDKVIKMDPLNYVAQLKKVQILVAKNEIEAAAELLKRLDSSFAKGIPFQRAQIKLALAQILIRQQDPAGARSQLKGALQINPQSQEAILMLAKLDLSPGAGASDEETMAAQRSLKSLLEQRPGLYQAELLLARAYRMRGRLDEASNIFHEQIKRDAKNPAPHFMLGVNLRAQGRVDDAILEFEEAQRLAPNEQNTTLQLIALDIQKGDFATAHRRAQAQLDREQGEEDWGAHYLMGQVLVAEKKWDEAEKILLRALELKPDSASVYNLLVDSYVAAGNEPKAIAQLEKLLELQPDNVQRRMVLALLHERNANFPAAIESYGRVLEGNPEFVPALNNLAYITGEILGDYNKAFELADRAHALAPEEAGVTDTLGWILYHQGNYSQALNLIEEAAEKLPEQAEIQYHLGMTRAKMGQDALARIALEKAVASTASYRGKDQAEERLAQLGGAAETTSVAELEKFLAEHPEDLIARTQLGLAYEQEGSYAKAAATFTAALEANSELIAPLIGLARLYAGPLDDTEKALSFADRARDLSPGNSDADGVRGVVALKQGQFEYAYGLLQSALNSAQSNNRPLFQLAMAQAAFGYGKLDEARRWMTQLVAAPSGTSPPMVAEAESFLRLTAPIDVDPSGMEAAAQQRLSKDPQDLPSLMAVASIQAGAEQAAPAIETLSGILDRRPNFIPAQRLLAAIYARDPEQRDEALRLCESVRRALPEDLGNTQTRGILASSEDPGFAVQLLNSVDAKSALDAEGLLALGEAYAKLGKNKEGSTALQRALDAGLPDHLKQQARKALEALATKE